MTSIWRSLVPAVVAIAGALSLPAREAAAQARELGLNLKITTQDPTLVVGSVYAALRPAERSRIAVTAGLGAAGGRVTGRGELLAQFLLDPAARGGVGLYGGGGLALVTGATTRGYVVLMLGIEGRPGARSGWALEAGYGGGFRVAAGYRLRWLAPRQ